MQKNSASRRAGRKRKTWSEYDLDEEYDDVTPVKRSRRLSALSFSEFKTHCEKILIALMDHKDAWPFNTPVDPAQLGIPDYFDKIKKPMDFGTIKTKLEGHEYVDVDEFANDVKLVFDNCWSYNEAGSDIYNMATTLAQFFEKQYRQLRARGTAPKKSEQDEIKDMQNIIAELRNEHQKLLNELQKLVKGKNGSDAERSNIGVNGAKSKPKRSRKKPVVKIEEPETFTVKQKTLLSEKINKLTAEDLQQMVDLIEAELPESAKQSGELEIDLEALSVSTLKKLDVFVDSCLKRQGISIDIALSPLLVNKREESSSESDSSDSSDSDSEKEMERKPENGQLNEASA